MRIPSKRQHAQDSVEQHFAVFPWFSPNHGVGEEHDQLSGVFEAVRIMEMRFSILAAR